MNNTCLGCGLSIQTKKKEEPGYCPRENTTLCERCYRLLHYHELKMDKLSMTNEELLNEIVNYQKTCFFFMDLFQTSKETIKWFHQIPKSKYLILTKTDLLPKSMNLNKLIKRIKDIYHIEEDILCFSKKSKTSLINILGKMPNHGIFVGMTNAGKSSFIKEASNYLTNKKYPILVSEMPNTTLSFINWNVKNFKWIDAPGFSYETNIDPKIMLKAVPKKMIKPRNYQMKKETHLFFDDILVLSQDLEKNSITFYGNNEFKIEKKFKAPMEYEIKKEISIPEKSDFVIPGVGFFNIAKQTTLTIYLKTEINYEIRPSLFGGTEYDSN